MASGEGVRVRKVAGVLGATAAGLGLLFSYRSHPGVAATALPPRPTALHRGVARFAVGEPAFSPNGPVKVEVFEVGTRITDVEALSLPNDNAHSVELSNYSGPRLRHEALAAQSANIQSVTGATMTSSAYKQSLQSAIERLHDAGEISVMGPKLESEFGPVEVAVVFDKGRISAVRALEMPEDNSLAASLSNYAAPILAAEAVRRQSALIDGVSGATTTSAAYRTSLQGALDAFEADR